MNFTAGALVVLATSAAWAEPTQVFPLTGVKLPPERHATTERLTRAIADAIDGEVSRVAIEDAAGLLECDVEATSCLEAVSKSLGDKQLVFGTVAPGSGKVLKVTLTRFRPGPDRRQQTYTLAGEDEAYPDELIRKSAALFGGKPPPVTTEPDPIEPTPAPEPIDAPRAGKVTAGSWVLIGGGAIAVGLGIGFRVSAAGIADDVNAFPTPQNREDFDRLTALEDRGTLHTRLAVGLIAVGGVALTAGIIRAVVQRRSERRDNEHVVSLMPLRGGAAITVTWGTR